VAIIARMIRVLKSVELPNRLTLPYVEQGDPNGLPVLFLHGATDSWRSFEHVLPHLPPGIRACALSQRGHGDAGRPAAGYRTRDFAADIAAFVTRLDLGPCVVVGHSMGSTHALRFAIDHPKLVSGLVLVACFASYRRNPAVVALCEQIASLEDPIDPGFVREFQESTLANPIAPGFFQTIVRESLKMPAHVWRAVFAGFLEDDFSAELPRVAAPALILWGDRDAFCPRADQEALVDAIPRSQLIAYHGVGHAVHWEKPQRFAADVVAFSSSLRAEAKRTARMT
jgi:non-heme chloroperoxidase